MIFYAFAKHLVITCDVLRLKMYFASAFRCLLLNLTYYYVLYYRMSAVNFNLQLATNWWHHFMHFNHNGCCTRHICKCAAYPQQLVKPKITTTPLRRKTHRDKITVTLYVVCVCKHLHNDIATPLTLLTDMTKLRWSENSYSAMLYEWAVLLEYCKNERNLNTYTLAVNMPQYSSEKVWEMIKKWSNSVHYYL